MEVEPQNAHEVTASMTALYDYYYTSHAYSSRYPKPNRATLEFLLNNGAEHAASILDYGCGSGRYALALLQRTQARVIGYDLSQPALNEFSAYLQGSPFAARATLLCGKAELLEGRGGYDVIMMMFGVLSHVGDRAVRLKTLRHLRSLITDRGRLILTVPSIFRRRPLELLNAKIRRATGRATEPLKEPGSIMFTRNIANKNLHFFYHLYTVNGLKEELLEAGFVLRTLSPESVLPEWMITQSDLLGKIDAALLPLLPASLGYGICVAAEPV
jgi:2-polyprenyl-3-methyl-5-hydroxy-6-metoxy-1,4-benzoquinol methylase